MKKQFISFFTALIFSVSMISVSPIINGISAAAFEITSEETGIDETLQLTDEVLGQYKVDVPGCTYLFNEETYRFYDQLDANNKASYKAMEDNWISPSVNELEISLTESLTFNRSTSDISQWSDDEKNEFWQEILNSVYSAKNAFMFDYPEVFWINEKSISLTCSDVKSSRKIFGGYTIKVFGIKILTEIKDEFIDPKTTESCRIQLEKSLEDFTTLGDNNYSKVKYIHDIIAQKAVYNINGTYRDSVYGFFCDENSEIVCEGYAKSFKLLCDRENIPCVIVVGNFDTETKIAHMWNYVQMDDGEWYGIDCTWDDTDLETSPIKYSYFLKGSANFVRHTPDTEYITPGFVYPELCEKDYIYENTEPDTSETEPTATYVKGDYNKNGNIDYDDIEIIKNKLVNISKITEDDLKHDMNNDKVINVYDYILMKRYFERGIKY